MIIKNTYDTIIKYFYGKGFNLETWREYAAHIFTELPGKCECDAKDYDFESQVLPVITSALKNKNQMDLTEHSFQMVTDELADDVWDLFGYDTDFTIILYLGLCNGAGWATTLEENDVILLGIEKIIELGWSDYEEMQALIYHEVGHIWHKKKGNLYFPAATQRELSILQLYQEGVAMRCQQILCKDDNFYHQNKGNWLAWCQTNEVEIKTEYLRRLDGNENTQDFFGDWCSYKGFPDVGYFLGCKFIKYLEKAYSLKEIANLSYDTLNAAFINYAAVL